MAQVMAQRPVVATKPKLTQKQSTETVQVMLYTSVSAALAPFVHFIPLTWTQASMLCRIR